MEINEDLIISDIIAEEYTKCLWDLIKDVQDKKDGSLLKLASQLPKETPWTDQNTYE